VVNFISPSSANNSKQVAQLLLRKEPIVRHSIEQPCSMLTMVIPDVKILAVSLFTCQMVPTFTVQEVGSLMG